MLLILDHLYLDGNLSNSKIVETKALEPLKSWHLYQQFLNLLISQRDMSGPRLGALSSNRWSGGGQPGTKALTAPLSIIESHCTSLPVELEFSVTHSTSLRQTHSQSNRLFRECVTAKKNPLKCSLCLKTVCAFMKCVWVPSLIGPMNTSQKNSKKWFFLFIFF
jgi:hypothetical protein